MVGVKRDSATSFSLSFLLCCLTKVASDQRVIINLTAINSEGRTLNSSDSVEENTKVLLLCSYSFTGRTEKTVVSTSIFTKRFANESWERQVSCETTRPDSPAIVNIPSSSVDITTSNVTCSPQAMNVSVLLTSNSPPYFTCRWCFQTNSPTKNSTTQTIWTYSKNTKPQLKQTDPVGNATVIDGNTITHVCSLTARPPPILKLTYKDIKIPPSELTHWPSIDSITEDSPETTSYLTWTTKSRSSMHGESLTCQVVDHVALSGRSSQLKMNVYFGPEPKENINEEWNVVTSDIKVVNCSLRCNGCVSYEWYETSVSPENKIAHYDRILKLHRSFFSTPHGSLGCTAQLICKTSNAGYPGYRRRSRSLHFTLKIHISTSVVSNTSTGFGETRCTSCIGKPECQGFGTSAAAVIKASAMMPKILPYLLGSRHTLYSLALFVALLAVDL